MSVGILASVVSATGLNVSDSAADMGQAINLNVDYLSERQPVATIGETDVEPGFGGAIKFGVQTGTSSVGFVAFSINNPSVHTLLFDTAPLASHTPASSARLSELGFGAVLKSRASAELVLGGEAQGATQKASARHSRDPYSGEAAVRDLRHTNTQAPPLYLFVSADNQALVWGIADTKASNGMALRDQVTIGDLQMGLAWASPFGGRTALGMVQRTIKYNDRTGDHDISDHQRFAAISYSIRA